MISVLYITLLPVLSAVAGPLTLQNNADVQPLLSQGSAQYPGFSLDLTEKRLIQFDDTSDPIWMTELDKIEAKAHGKTFMDMLRDTRDLGALSSLRFANSTFYPTPNSTEAIRSVLDSLSTSDPIVNLEKFTSFRTRYYRSDTGRESQKWLLSRILEITDQSAPAELRNFISILEFPHSWGQSTIIARINGTSSDDSIVIIGAHQDSTNIIPFLPAPGADDDGSGSVSILEAYRGLICAGFRPNRTVEFHWYSAEEGGLLGSQAVARMYEARSVNVYGMIQFDMTAWIKRGTREEAGIITDFTDPDLTHFVTKLVTEYLRIPYVETKCGYACSDHASWRKAGYRTAFAIESAMENSNRNIHTTRDRIDISPEFSFDHIVDFARLAAAFAMELGGWNKH